MKHDWSNRSIALVIEDQIDLNDVCDFSTAVALLLGLIYALNLDHLKDLRYTFEVIQKVFMGLGTQCSAWGSCFKE
ncbi:unnamed protein product [Oreochromis niloticus]|nr:unnamed protein product [Mustela putorius furo]